MSINPRIPDINPIMHKIIPNIRLIIDFQSLESSLLINKRRKEKSRKYYKKGSNQRNISQNILIKS